MTKKDYILISSAIRNQLDDINPNDWFLTDYTEKESSKARIYAIKNIHSIIIRLADKLLTDNSKFARDKFFRSCGL